MEITERQLKELCDIASAIDDENRIDDDVTGGYIDEPYKSIIDRIYAVVNECDRKEIEASENTLPIHGVSNLQVQHMDYEWDRELQNAKYKCDLGRLNK